jgi:uncharacterized membrane protein YkgB
MQAAAPTEIEEIQEKVNRIDRRIAGWMRRNGPLLVRVALAIVFIWFGILKPLGQSTATDLVTRTVYWVDPAWFIPLLGWWEVGIGVCMLIRPLLRLAVLLLFLQMPGTFLPLVLLPEICFESAPLVPTLEGQYIIKNLVLIAAAIVVGGTVRERPAATGPDYSR